MPHHAGGPDRLLHAEEQVQHDYARYYDSKGWLTCDDHCTKLKRRWEQSQAEVATTPPTRACMHNTHKRLYVPPHAFIYVWTFSLPLKNNVVC